MGINGENSTLLFLSRMKKILFDLNAFSYFKSLYYGISPISLVILANVVTKVIDFGALASEQFLRIFLGDIRNLSFPCGPVYAEFFHR